MLLDTKSFTKIESRFQNIFEPKLIIELCQNSYLREFEPDKTIVDIGTEITHMPLVISGSIKVLTENEEGVELLLYYLELGETCAVTLNCCSRKSKSSVRAISETDAEMLFVPVERMDDWMVKFKSWRTYVLDSYNERLNEIVKAIDNIVFHSLEERLRMYIKDKVWATKSAVLNITHQDIANELYSSRVAISRLMKKLENDNFIEQQRNKIIVVEYNK